MSSMRQLSITESFLRGESSARKVQLADSKSDSCHKRSWKQEGEEEGPEEEERVNPMARGEHKSRTGRKGGGGRNKPTFAESRRRVSCCSTLIEAARASHVNCVEWHLKQENSRAEILQQRNVRGPKALHEAAGAKPTNNHSAEEGQKPSCTLCLEAILSAGADASELDEGGRSPLHRAAMVGCVPCIEALIASPSTKVDAVSDRGSTALIEALKINSAPAVRVLIAPPASASLEPLDSYQRRGPLVKAVEAGAYDCIALLVEAGAPLNPVPCTLGRLCNGCDSFALLAAARSTVLSSDKVSDILRLLVKLGADVEAKVTCTIGPFCGRSPLHVSSSQGRCNATKVLLELGADPMALDDDGGSALHLAAASSESDACELLTEHIRAVSGSAKTATALVAKDKQGRTPIHRAAMSAPYWRAGDEAASASCLLRLLRSLEAFGGPEAVASALRETVGEKGRNVLHIAAEKESVDFLRMLTERPEGLRVALECPDDAGLTPVALAQQEGHDFDDIPAFSQMAFVPCCGNIAEASQKAHVTCLKNILKDRDALRGEKRDAVTIEGECAADPLATVPHRRRPHCSKIVRLLLEAGFHPDGSHGDSAPLRDAADVVDFGDSLCQACTRLLIDAGASGLYRRYKKEGDLGDFCGMQAILAYASQNGGDEALDLTRAALGACDLKHDKDGVTNLCFWAGELYNLEVLKLLAEAGADIKATTKFGETALHIATELQDICDSCYDIDGEDEVPGDSAEHVELVKWLVSKGAVVDGTDNAGRTPMHMAVKQGFGNVLSTLLDLGADPLLRDDNGDTALHMAAGAGSTEMVARFIELGVDVNTLNNSAETALHHSSSRGTIECVRMLIDKGGIINAKTSDGSTPLRYAARRHESSVLMYFLDNKMGDPSETHIVLGNLLHSAAHSGSTDSMQLLMDRGFGLASTIPSTGETVMHMAAQSGHGPAVKWLLGKGASLDASDDEGKVPAISAVVEARHEDYLVRSVLEAIAESTGGNKSLRAVFAGRSLLHLASGFGNPYCVEFLISKGAGVDSKTVSTAKETAVHCAARFGHASVVRTLAKAGANMNLRDARGMTPIHNAAKAKSIEILTLLLDLGASCNIADRAGRTPLAIAAQKGHLSCCSLLVARGADVTLRDTHGRTALGLALGVVHGRRKEREAVMRLLIELGCPIDEAEIYAASRGTLAASFAKAITARMSSGAAAHQLAKATSKAYGTVDVASHVPGQHGEICSGGMVSGSLLVVRLTRAPPPTFPSRRLPSSAGRVNGSCKIYRIDIYWLRHAVSHLEGPGEAAKCPLLKLLLPPATEWVASYRDVPAEGASGTVEKCGKCSPHSSHLARPTARVGLLEAATSPRSPEVVKCRDTSSCPQPMATLAAEVGLFCNGDDFDQDGFEAVMEYLLTGQVVGATCGSIHGDARASTSDTVRDVGLRAVATHRAAGFFGLPRLQSMVRGWLKANGAEMEDDGTGVLSEAVARDWSTGDGSRKRKFEAAHDSSTDEDEDDDDDAPIQPSSDDDDF